MTDDERRNLNNPVAFWRKWTAATRVKKPKPRAAGMAVTPETMAAQLQERVTELEEELATARAPGLRDLLQRILDEAEVGDALRAEIAALLADLPH